MAAQKRVLTTLFLTVFTDLVGFGIVIPLLPLYAEHYRPAPWVFGLLMASFSAMQFVFAPVLGHLSDRIGRRPVLLVSLAGSVAGYLLFAAAHSLAMLFASRILAGIAGANISTAQAVIADVTPPQERARGMGLIGAAFGLGFIAGPALGGLLVSFGEAAPGLGAAACSGGALLLTLLVLPESLPPERGGKASAPHSAVGRLLVARRRAGLGPLLGLGFLVVSAMSMFEVTFAQFLHGRFDMSHSQVAFVFVYVGVLAAIVQGGLVGRVARKIGEGKMMAAGLVLAAVGLTLIASSRSVGAMLAAAPLLSLGQGFAIPSLSALVSHTASGQEQGEVLGAFQGVNSLARVAGPFAGEMVLGALGVAAPPFAAAILAAIAGVGAVVYLRGR